MATERIETDRLVLRRFVPEDYKAMYEWAKLEEVSRYFPWNPMNEIEQAKEKMQTWVNRYEDDNYYHWGIELKSSMELIGTINLRVDGENNNAETSYLLLPQYWNAGLMTEVLQAVLQFGFDRVGLHRIAAEVFEGNVASEKVLLKCGLRKEGTLRDLYQKNEVYIDSTYYSILYSEFVKSNG